MGLSTNSQGDPQEGDPNFDKDAWIISELESLVQGGDDDQTFLPLTKKAETERITNILKGKVKTRLDVRPRSRQRL